MATLLDPPKPSRSVRDEEFVERQLVAARRRVRLLDYFLAGLSLGVVSLFLLLIALLVNRYFETPRGTGWAALGVYLALAGGFLYLSLFRTSRRQINPYFAARRVEETVPNAKNSLVTWVDFEEDERLPGSIRTAIGQKAARDLKGVDLNRAIENRRILWLAIAAGVFLLANVVVAFLKPTRTELRLEEPKDGDITVFNNQDVNFQVHVTGRIPSPNDADAVRLRLWYNADDAEAYEDRPMHPAEDDRRQFLLTVPAKQVRNGFQYKVLAGKTETPAYTVTCKIIPEFTGFDVRYDCPTYVKRTTEPTNDPNLLAPYGTQAKLIATVNREVKHGHIEIEGQARTIDGRTVEGRPDAIEFTVPIEKEGFFRIWITTPEGDKNQDPARLRLGVIDPKPVFRMFDLAYTYPEYLRFKPMTVVDAREPEIEGLRGTKVVLTAKTTREVKDARVEIDDLPPIIGEKVPDEPTWVRFKLPAIEKDGIAKVIFTPTTDEGLSAPRSIPIRVLFDQTPTVKLTEPEKAVTEVPANGSLQLKGEAFDDHGVDRLILKMKLVGAEDRDLVPKPYRDGKSFLRKEDNSWPTRVEYKDFIKLQDLRMEKNPTWRVAAGMEIDVWLEAIDNCTEPRPNTGVSEPAKRIRVMAPVTKPEEKKKIDDTNKKLDNEQQQHEKKQDQTNANDKRDVNQEPPKGAENPGKDGRPQEKGSNDANPMKDPNPAKSGMGDPTGTPPEGSPDHAKDTEQVEQAIKYAANANKPGAEKPSGATPPDAKVDPGAARVPKEGPMGSPPPAEDRTPKNDPNNDPMGGKAGESRDGNVDKTKEEKGTSKPGGETKPGMTPDKSEEKPSFGGNAGGDSGPKPEPKDPPKTANNPAKPEKGTARKDPSKAQRPRDPMDGGAVDETLPGATKPDQEVKSGEDKKPSGEPGKTGETVPKDASASKPQQRPAPGDKRPEPKKDQVADASETRGGPKDGMDPGETQPMPKGGGNKDEVTRGQQKPGPQSTPPEQGPQPSELNREIGELSREINSTNPEVSDKAKDDVSYLMRNPQTREQTRKDLDTLEREAKDQLSRKKAQDLRNRGEQAAKDYDNDKPTQEKVDQLAKKMGSKDERERKEAEQRANDWKNNPETKKDFEDEVAELKKKDRDAGERVEKATKKDGQANADNQTPKIDDKQLADMAKDLNGSDEKAKQDAKDRLEKMMRDPKTAKEAQERLNQMADKATGQDKKDLENAAKQAGDMAKEIAKKDSPTPKLDPKDLKDLASKMAGNDEKAKQDAQKQMQEMMNDPKTREQAMKMLEEMAKNDKNSPDEQKALQDALKEAAEMAKKDPPKFDPKDLKDLAEKFKNMDAQAKENLRKKTEEALKDPKTRDEVKKAAEEMAKNATPEQKKEFDEMMRQLAGNNPEFVSNPDPADPRNKLKAAEMVLDKFKKNITNEDFVKTLKWTEEQQAQWIKDQEAVIAALRKQAEKSDWRTDRNVASPIKGGPTTIKLDPKTGNDPLFGGKPALPSGYTDAYKKFAGGGSATDPKK